ncbi:S9 family peptidase [Roseinatronobacter monicus]|uniref:S9 family peptidase n=1 Tax=Roseinatronobacter monicus TaxID=393481 RepID=UPI003F333DCF
MTRLQKMKPPVANQIAVTQTAHGLNWTDEYAWIRADNWQEVLRDPAALPGPIDKLLRAENRYCAALMKDSAPLQKLLIAEMRGRIKEDDSSPPSKDGPFAYYQRYNKGGEHPLICRRPRDGGKEERLLDGQKLSRGKDFFDLGDHAHSPDHQLLAWSSDEAGSELYTIRVRDLTNQLDLADAVLETTGDMVWATDASCFYYVAVDASHRPSRVYRHVLGELQSADVLIHEEHDAGMFVTISETQSGAYMLIDVGDHETSEVRLVELSQSDATAVLVHPRQTGLRYDIEHHGERFFILTNKDGADDMKIMSAPMTSPGITNWAELVPYRAGCMIISHVCLKGRMVRMERENSLPRIVIHDLASGEESAIAFDEEAYGLGMDAGYEFDTDWLRFTYASMARPTESYDYNMATRERILIKRQEVPSGHDPERYKVRRVFATAADGAVIPVSVLHLADLDLDGTAPCLLYGYGSYGSSMSAAFRVRPLSLVDRGFVYAIAHVRGGTEKGWNWYQDGKLHKKSNTFTDFIAVGEELARLNYTAQGRIVAEGGSAGGLLMGAVANLAPDLFAGIIADVPFVDVLNTIMDASMPLTPPEWPEWGNPITDPEAFRTIQSYSPYEIVKAQSYPPILAIAGLTDPRVTYWEPAKWVQRLRQRMTGGGPILMQTNMSAGHGGSAGRFDSLKETALTYAFAIKAANGFRSMDDEVG